jgi:hypothetical protein
MNARTEMSRADVLNPTLEAPAIIPRALADPLPLVYTIGDRDYSAGELRDMGRAVAEQRAKKAARADDLRDALGEPMLRLLTCQIARISLDAVAAQKMAFAGALETEMVNAAWFMTAIESIAMTIARRCDVVSEILGDIGAGNFADELEPDSAIAATERAQPERQD